MPLTPFPIQPLFSFPSPVSHRRSCLHQHSFIESIIPSALLLLLLLNIITSLPSPVISSFRLSFPHNNNFPAKASTQSFQLSTSFRPFTCHIHPPTLFVLTLCCPPYYVTMASVEASRRFLGGPRMGVGALWKEAMAFAGSLWAVAFLFGLMIGWVWKPRWVVSRGDKLASCVSEFLCSSLPSSPTSRQLMSPLKGFASAPCFNSFTLRSPNCDPSLLDNHRDSKPPPSVSPIEYDHCSTSRLNEEQFNIASLVAREDLEYLYQLVEVKDGGPTWIQMMDRSTPTMSYQAWRRDPKGGPPQYRTRTVFEDASPEVVRDFFWDDEFRPKWDDMLAYSATLDECPTTGTMIVHWIRKFPFFCSDREYIIGRRIWESGRSYYCVTKGVPGASIPRRNKPRRVDLYYSSWCIRAVESRRGDGQLTACEVMLFHYEDMGIPWEIAKLGVRQGMWGTVKKIEPGLRAYQKGRASGAELSRPAFLAQINTQISPGLLISLGGVSDSLETEAANTSERPAGMNIPKILIIGGAIVLACSIDRGLLTKTFTFGVARKFANIGKRT